MAECFRDAAAIYMLLGPLKKLLLEKSDNPGIHSMKKISYRFYLEKYIDRASFLMV